MIQIDELPGLGDVINDVEPANRFKFRNFKGGSGRPKGSAFGDIACPLVIGSQIVERFGFFDKYVHEPED